MKNRRFSKWFAILSLCAVLLTIFPSFGLAYGNGLTLLGSATLGSAASTISVSSIPASSYYKIVFYTPSFASSDSPKLQFNTDTGNNYGYKTSSNGAATANTNADTGVRLVVNNEADAFFCTVEVWSVASTEKIGSAVCTNAFSGSTNAPSYYVETGFQWANTSDLISTITFRGFSSNNLNSGTTLEIYGYDSGSVASLPANASGLLKNDGSGNLSWDNASTVKSFLSLGNVENTALSTWTGSTNITQLGTIGTGIWNGTVLTVPYGGTSLSTITSGAFMRGNGTSAPSLLSPSASATDYLDGTGAWSVPAGGGGGSLPSDAEGYLWNDGAGALTWEGGTGTNVTNYDTMFDAVALLIFAGAFAVFFFVGFYKAS